MSTRRRWTLAARLSSVASNTAGVALLIEKARHAGGIRYIAQKLRLQHPPEMNYPRLAREFGWLPRTTDDIVFMGDSHIENPLLVDLVTGVKQLGVGGQAIADVRSWVGQDLATPLRQLVLLAGTSDVPRNRSATDAASSPLAPPARPEVEDQCGGARPALS